MKKIFMWLMSGSNLSTGAKRNPEGSNSAPDLMSHVRLLPVSDESEKNREKINTRNQRPSYSSKVGKKIFLASLGIQWKPWSMELIKYKET